MPVRILTLVGSLRAASYNRKLAEAAVKHAPEGVDIDLYEGLADVPFYNEDIDTDDLRPESANRLREAAARADAVLLVCPEYNGTVPAVLKNAIDWLSRPYGASALSGLPTAVVGAALGQYGGVWAHDDARKAARIAGAVILDDATLAIPKPAALFGELHPADHAGTVGDLVRVLDALAEAAATAVSAT